jgi:hypothetical protein
MLSSSYSIDKPATFNSQSLTVTKTTYNFQSASPYRVPGPTRQFLLLSIKLTNISGLRVSYQVADLSVRNSAGDLIGRAFLTGVPDSLTSGSIDPNDEVTGNLGFEIPKDTTDLKLIFAPRSWGGRWIVIDLNQK